jgi:hypothetical protein
MIVGVVPNEGSDVESQFPDDVLGGFDLDARNAPGVHGLAVAAWLADW